MKWSKFKIVGPKPKPIKLPAQKSPDRFAQMKVDDLAEKAAIKKFGDKPEYMGMKITNPLAEDYATKVENRLFFKSLRTGLKTTRKTTATGIKGLRAQGKKPKKFKITIAKSKGADVAYKAADKKGQAAFSKIVERYTGRAKASISKNRTISTTVKQTGTRAENLREKKATRDAFKAMGIDDRVESNFRTRYYTKRTKGGKVLSDTFTEQVTDSQGRVLTGKKKRQALLFDKLFKD